MDKVINAPTLTENIRKRRIELNISQQELANAMGYKSRSTIAKIESGTNDIPQSKLEKFAEVLDTSLNALLGIELPDVKPLYQTNSSDSKNIAVILAGGKSTRNPQDIPNQFISVAGKPIILYSLEVYQNHPAIDDIYVVCLDGWEDILKAYTSKFGITKLRDFIPAGETGIQSVYNCVRFLQKRYQKNDTIIFQESTRPMIQEEMLSKLIHECQESESVILCSPMQDYVQFYHSENSTHLLERDKTICAESPEAHKLSVLLKLFDEVRLKHHDLNETCCALLLYNMNYPITFCESNALNLKITKPTDLVIFSALIRQQI